MEFLWSLIGAMAVLLICGLRSWIKKGKKKVTFFSWLGIFVFFLLALFSTAWMISCFIEGETRAAVIGFSIFGTVTMVIFAITRKKILKDSKTWYPSAKGAY